MRSVGKRLVRGGLGAFSGRSRFLSVCNGVVALVSWRF